MIKASELMIGNYVTVNNPMWAEMALNAFEVTGIQERHEKDFPLSDSVICLSGGMSQFNEFVDPIPLTDEWLVKLGFEENKCGFVYGEDCFEIELCNGFYYQSVEYFEYIIGEPIKFVHELQCVFYWHKRKQLTIKTEV